MPNDDVPVTTDAAHARTIVLSLYEQSLGDVYGYLIRRCPSAAVAEDLTAETFLAAARAATNGTTELSVGWLIGTARHKLVDHWRRDGRQRQALADLWDEPWASASEERPSDTALDVVDALHVRDLLARLTPDHRTALTLRYLDGLPVPDVASTLGRSVHATESLLVRARAAYRDLAEHRPSEGSHS